MTPFRFRKLPARFATVLLPFLLSLMMTFIISGISTLLALGPSLAFLRAWPVSWAMSWMIGFPTLLVVLPLVRRLVGKLVAAPEAR
ncbi:DUF2798 domain-containing protein [Siccirubricoccus sp. KC 17139]|uniref:DUF2798 domain-containing protein n=1 Tax=Siccirubricoccus soli TaxID=2899147 RepID=A0ABT1D0T6_9PROT|nr:DUF2798 domain-containing protein [Siccirubricoccus soli]MCO6414910.1 DUF2798 domain-containing protein [Siccirubricoccus soli]MCP2681040.1 DUF2798 domain-containing protein [Siccirubricoccus soli]